MRARINFRPNVDQLHDAFASFHLGIILRACYGFKATNYAGSNGSPHNRNSQSKMRSGSDGLACFTKCFAESRSEMRSSLHRQPTVAPAGRKLRRALNLVFGLLSVSSVLR